MWAQNEEMGHQEYKRGDVLWWPRCTVGEERMAAGIERPYNQRRKPTSIILTRIVARWITQNYI